MNAGVVCGMRSDTENRDEKGLLGRGETCSTKGYLRDVALPDDDTALRAAHHTVLAIPRHRPAACVRQRVAVGVGGHGGRTPAVLGHSQQAVGSVAVKLQLGLRHHISPEKQCFIY